MKIWALLYYYCKASWYIVSWVSVVSSIFKQRLIILHLVKTLYHSGQEKTRLNPSMPYRNHSFVNSFTLSSYKFSYWFAYILFDVYCYENSVVHQDYSSCLMMLFIYVRCLLDKFWFLIVVLPYRNSIPLFARVSKLLVIKRNSSFSSNTDLEMFSLWYSSGLV